jgi:hypothetical protein
LSSKIKVQICETSRTLITIQIRSTIKKELDKFSTLKNQSDGGVLKLSCNGVGKIRTTQDKLTIELDTCLDLTSGVADVAIEYRKPDLTTGSWIGAVTEKTKVSYTLADDEFFRPARGLEL